MRFHSEKPDNASRKSGLSLLTMLLFALFAGGVAIMMILDHRNPVNNALETGQCLVGEGTEEFLEMLRHFLHHAYRWIFKTCS